MANPIRNAWFREVRFDGCNGEVVGECVNDVYLYLLNSGYDWTEDDIDDLDPDEIIVVDYEHGGHIRLVPLKEEE